MGWAHRDSGGIAVNSRLKLFRPMRQTVFKLSCVVLLLDIVGIYYLLQMDGIFTIGGILLSIPVVLLSIFFIYIFLPLLRNQRLVISGGEIVVITFAQIDTINFATDLVELYVLYDDVIAYRFATERNYFQITPEAYYEAESLRKIMEKLMKKYRLEVPIVMKGQPHVKVLIHK